MFEMFYFVNLIGDNMKNFIKIAFAGILLASPGIAMAADLSKAKSKDGQPLIVELEKKAIPERPADPKKLPETDSGHWYDMEYAGWSSEATAKVNPAKSPGDGAKNKKVVYIINGDHPYLTALSNGAQKVADAYGIDLTVLSPNWDLATQNQQLDEAIAERPDMIILIPLDAKGAVQQARKVNQSGVPLLLSNMLPGDDALKYVVGWTGPDDWGQFRMLARAFADKMGKKGGYACIRHAPGGSPYFARCMGPVTEINKYAPNMKFLDHAAPGFKPEETMRVVSDWITRYGKDLNGIVLADDSAQLLGAIEAIKKSNRKDIVLVAAGNSQVGMEAVKKQDATAITYQNPEIDGAVAVKTAADWFEGKDVPPIVYLPKKVLNSNNVSDYMPGSW